MTQTPSSSPSQSVPPVGITFKSGDRIRLTEQTIIGGETWTTTTEGTVVSFKQKKTGSWFAHSKDDRLWLDRLELCKDDGELVVCNLDRICRLEVLNGTTADGTAKTGGDDGGANVGDTSSEN